LNDIRFLPLLNMALHEKLLFDPRHRPRALLERILSPIGLAGWLFALQHDKIAKLLEKASLVR
jgi:hypothetical protein